MDEFLEEVEESEEETESQEKGVSVLKAVKNHCLECSGYQREEVKECPRIHCNLYPFRFGKNPYRKKRQMSEEQKQAMKERMSKYWKNKDSV